MHRTRHLLLSLAVLGSVLVASTATVSAGSSVDPNTLTPVPPPGAICSANGPQVICSTTFDESALNEPAFTLSCGTVYLTSSDLRVGRRWYDEDGLLVRRHVVRHAVGTWSLSPDGDGPVVSFVGHQTWGEVYLVPGDESSADGHIRGTDLLAKSPDGGVVAHVSGREADDGFHGLFLLPEDPALDAAICDALGA
jgi:hypothetical protein